MVAVVVVAAVGVRVGVGVAVVAVCLFGVLEFGVLVYGFGLGFVICFSGRSPTVLSRTVAHHGSRPSISTYTCVDVHVHVHDVNVDAGVVVRACTYTCMCT